MVQIEIPIVKVKGRVDLLISVVLTLLKCLRKVDNAMSASAAGGATEFEDAATQHSLVIRDRILSEDDAFQPKSEENTFAPPSPRCWKLLDVALSN